MSKLSKDSLKVTNEHIILKTETLQKIEFYFKIPYFRVYHAHLFYQKIFRRNGVRVLHEETNLPVFIRVVIDLMLPQFLFKPQSLLCTVHRADIDLD